MSSMPEEAREFFEELHIGGMEAKNAGNHKVAAEIFEMADELAVAHGDERARLYALNPAARAHWTLGNYGLASEKLAAAAEIAHELNLTDESAIALSNLGRVAAVRLVRMTVIEDLPQVLREEAVPHFSIAAKMLKDHPHFYYRYANAQHGSVVLALAGMRKEAAALITDGLGVAFRKSPEPYDQVKTYRINPKGLGSLAVAAELIPLGNKTPVLSGHARLSLIR